MKRRQPAPDPVDDFRVYGTITVYDNQARELGLPESETTTLCSREMMIGPIDGRYVIRFTAPKAD